jgi:glyoxylase-like metal-dependent hydrolase (beta-lactamase superfamily II)
MSSSRISHGPVEGLMAGRYPGGPTTQVACYRIGRTLIDAGAPNQWSTVRQWVQEQDEAHGIERVLFTHHHEDHAGNAGRVQDLLDVPIYAPDASLNRLRDGFSIELYRRVVWGRPAPVEAEPVPDTLPLADGTRLRTIPTPGHADDMVCYFAEAYGLLFSADLYITRRPQYLRYDEHAPRLIDSLHTALRHNVHTLLCAHRGVVEDGTAALRDKARYLEALCGVVNRRYRFDKRTTPDIQHEILGREGLLYWVSGGDFSKQNLIASCLDAAFDTADSRIVE